MMQQMRGYAKSWIAYLFVIPLALSFGIWGISDFLHVGAPDTSLAAVGDLKIPPEQFQREYRNVQRQLSEKEHREITSDEAHARGLDKEVLQNEIDNSALEQAAAKYGLMTSDDEISSVIRDQPAFRNTLGVFDHDTLVQRLAQINMTEDDYIAVVRNEMTRRQLVTAAVNGLQFPQGYAKTLFAFLSERRAAEYVEVSTRDLPATPPPTDSQLTAYLKSRAAEFSTPEYRDITYVSVGPEELASQLKVTDADLKARYDQQKDQYQTPEKRDIEQIVFNDQASAKAARAKIDAGAKFDDVAKALGKSPTDISLGTLVQADLGAERGPAAFALPSGGVTQPIKFTFGWVLLHVTAITPAVNKTFDDVKATLKTQAIQQLAGAKISDMTNAFEDARAGGANFADAATRVGMRVTHIAQVDKNGLTPDGKKADMPAEPEFQAQLARAEIGEEGDPFPTSDEHAFAIKVNGVTPAKVKPLESVRAQIAAAWSHDQLEQQLAKLAASFAQQATADHSLKAVAARLHANVQDTGALSRSSQSGALPPVLIKRIFSVPAGNAVFAPASDGSYIVARVTGVVHPQDAADAVQYQRLGVELGNDAGQDMGSLLAHAWRDKLGVTINQANVDRLAGGS
jgi:peptidyl-prolyl cis-trans isomerase D